MRELQNNVLGQVSGGVLWVPLTNWILTTIVAHDAFQQFSEGFSSGYSNGAEFYRHENGWNEQ